MTTQYNKSEILRNAWGSFRSSNITFSQALKNSWNVAKNPVKPIVIETYKYAGKMANGFHDSLFELTIDGTEVTVSYASISYDSYKYGKQNDCTMVANSGAAIELSGWKSRPTVLGLGEQFLSQATKVKGNTFEVKEVIKQYGFQFDGVTKSWVK